jgi:putative Holliday junction resolvase
MKPDATILAFDFGTRRIGVANGNSLTRVAHALTTVSEAVETQRIEAIAALIREWQPTQLLVGLPVHADGTPHAMTVRARRFARRLGDRFSLPVALVDERWTTQAADALLRGAGRDGRAARDATAAAVILQAWFDAADERA